MKFTTLTSVVALALSLASSRAGTILSDTFSYPDGPLTNVSSGKWVLHSGAGTGMNVTGGALQIAYNLTDDANAALDAGPYSNSGSVAALYAKFTLNMSSTLPNATGTYFAHFKDNTNNFRCRVWAATNGAAGGAYRLGIANSSGTPVFIPTDLSPDTAYSVVTRYALGTGVATIWLSPANEAVAGTSGTDSPAISYSATSYAFRQDTGEGILTVDDLVVGTKFVDMVPGSAGQNPPFVTLNPGNTNVVAGTAINLTVVAGGDDTLTYQWYKNSSQIDGATGSSHTMAPSVLDDAGNYYVRITNSAGSVYSRTCSVQVTSSAVAPNIVTHPQSTNAVYGDNVTFTVTATGTDPLSYQWQFYETNLPGGTSASYTVYSAYASNAGPYQVIVTNEGGAKTSYVATLTVGPPPVTSIASIRATVDTVNYLPTNTTSLYTIEGIVTTWASLTSAGNNSLFYMQDATAGIAVFWIGGLSGNTPPAGARVKVTAPITHFFGLLEMYPNSTNATHSVTVVSTGNPLPAPKPVPFNATAQADPAVMDALEGSYLVASNVFLSITNAGQKFASVSSGEFITNATAETFNMYINGYTDIPGQVKPAGPVTIFGVLGQFDNSNPRTSGYQLIPSRYADILSQAKAATVRFTNNISNQIRPDGLAVNTLSENVLRVGETLTMDVVVTDPDGGSVTVTPLTAGLPSGAGWTSGVQSGTRVVNQFHYTAASGDAGNNYTISLKTVTSTATTTNKWTVYVPTAVEQQIFISEILANPVTSSNSIGFNPLHRAEAWDWGTNSSSNLSFWDEYLEIVNLSNTDVDLYNWTISDAVQMRYTFRDGAPIQVLGMKSAVVVYGGPQNGFLPVLPYGVPSFPAVAEQSAGLALNNTGTETITLRNPVGNIVDRLMYTASDLSSAGSISRFPTINDWFVSQAYISTNASTPGAQFDGKAWSEPTTVTTAVEGVSAQAGNPLVISFPAIANQFYTLWSAPNVADTFVPANGAAMSSTAGAFFVTNPPPSKYFYFITQP